MNGISHEQARGYIQASADDLLNVNERHLLEEHLKDCESCCAYLAELERVKAEFQQAFHSRWDGQLRPTHLSIPYVQMKGRRIAMGKHILSGLRIAATVIGLLGLTLVTVYVVTLRQGKPIFNIPAFQVDNRPLIAFAAGKGQAEDIYTVKIDGSGLTNLTNDSADDGAPAWSPDGGKIAYVSNKGGIENIYTMDSNGGNVQQLTDLQTNAVAPAWSPDGKMIAFISGDWSTGKMNIYVMDADGQNQHTIVEKTNFSTTWPNTWNPDSQYIAYSTHQQIFRLKVNTGAVDAVTTPGNPSSLVDYAWSKDGSSLMYLTPCSEDLTCMVLHSVRADGKDDQILGQWQVPNICASSSKPCEAFHWIRWSPDATKIMLMFNNAEAGWIYIANTNGSDFRPLTNYPVLGNPPDGAILTGEWSPDSQSIVFMSSLDDPDTLSLYTLDIYKALGDPSTRPTRLTAPMLMDGTGSDPVWQPRP